MKVGDKVRCLAGLPRYLPEGFITEVIELNTDGRDLVNVRRKDGITWWVYTKYLEVVKFNEWETP